MLKEGPDALHRLDSPQDANGRVLAAAPLVSPRKAALLFVEYPDARFENHLLDGKVLNKEIDEWEQGEFHDARGEVLYALTWLNRDESERAWEAFEG